MERVSKIYDLTRSIDSKYLKRLLKRKESTEAKLRSSDYDLLFI